jgi:hypothetical protein
MVVKYGGDTQRKSKCKGKLIHASLFDFEAPEALVNPCIFSTILSHKKRKKKPVLFFFSKLSFFSCRDQNGFLQMVAWFVGFQETMHWL